MDGSRRIAKYKEDRLCVGGGRIETPGKTCVCFVANYKIDHPNVPSPATNTSENFLYLSAARQKISLTSTSRHSYIHPPLVQINVGLPRVFFARRRRYFANFGNSSLLQTTRVTSYVLHTLQHRIIFIHCLNFDHLFTNDSFLFLLLNFTFRKRRAQIQTHVDQIRLSLPKSYACTKNVIANRTGVRLILCQFIRSQ